MAQGAQSWQKFKNLARLNDESSYVLVPDKLKTEAGESLPCGKSPASVIGEKAEAMGVSESATILLFLRGLERWLPHR